MSFESFIQEHREIIQKENVPFSFIHESGLDYLAIKDLEITNTGFHEKVCKFILSENKVYQWQGEEVFEKTKPKVLRDKIEETIKKASKMVAHLDLTTEELEDKTFRLKSFSGFKENLYHLKDGAQVVERNIRRLHNVLKNFSFESQQLKNLGWDFQNDLEMLDFQLRNIEHLHKKLFSIEQYYSLEKAEKMNKNIYILTLASGLFLPLNLIVGFFGMNTTGLFFTDSPNGTLNVIIMLAVLVCLFVMAIPIYFTVLKVIRVNRKIKNYLYKKIIR